MQKYRALRSAASAARILGWLGVVIAALLILFGIAGVSAGTVLSYASGLYLWVAGIGILIPSILLVLIGEAVQVIIDIESNTRHAADLLGAASERLSST